MPSEKTYTLEYWINTTQFSKQELENYVKQSLEKFLVDIVFEIKVHEANYLILRITSTERVIDACHGKLEFEREWAFRVKDELGNFLRASAYPVLAEIELRLRNFINQAMVDVLGFDWWNSFISASIRERVQEVEKKAGENQVKFHHPIEFTLFEDLIKIVTAEFQAWVNERAITLSDLSELLSVSNSFEDIQRELENRRKVISFWNDIFSNYFDDKEAWAQLKKRIEGQVIPIRNKVMHHRLMRSYELQQLEDFRDEITRVISLAKTKLSDTELKEVLHNVRIVFDNLRPFQIDPDILKNLQRSFIDPEIFKAFLKPLIDPEIFKAFQKPFIDPEIFKAFQKPFIDPEIFKAFQKPLIDPEIFKAFQKPFIDPEIFKGLTPKINLDLHRNLTDVSDSSASQEETNSDTDESNTNNNSQDNDREEEDGNAD